MNAAVVPTIRYPELRAFFAACSIVRFLDEFLHASRPALALKADYAPGDLVGPVAQRAHNDLVAQTPRYSTRALCKAIRALVCQPAIKARYRPPDYDFMTAVEKGREAYQHTCDIEPTVKQALGAFAACQPIRALYGAPNEAVIQILCPQFLASGHLKGGADEASCRWLSNRDIDMIMHFVLAEYGNPSIAYVPANVCDISLRDLFIFAQRGQSAIGVSNTAMLGEPGQHWFAVAIDARTRRAYVYNSIPATAAPNLPAFIQNLREAGYIVFWSIVEAQFSAEECGFYAVHVLCLFLAGRLAEHFHDHIPDASIRELRRRWHAYLQGAERLAKKK